VATTLQLPSVLDAVADTGVAVIAAGGFFVCRADRGIVDEAVTHLQAASALVV
jgi:NAD(P)H-dependent flavin oxidoreductase YrpB (nitropropane dioxygenase family)